MKKLVLGIVVLMLASTAAFSQGSTKNQLDSCLVRFNNLEARYRTLNDENKKLKTENAALKSEKDKNATAANAEKDKLAKENASLKTKVTELEKKNTELSGSSGTLQTLATENNRLATENMNLKNQLAAQSNAVPAAAADKYSYPISGVLTNKSVNGNVIVADLVFTNNGSKTITSFDCMLKFYYQGNKIYEISLPGVKNQAGGTAFGRQESINFRAGLPVTDQNLVNAGVDMVDMIVEVTKVQ